MPVTHPQRGREAVPAPVLTADEPVLAVRGLEFAYPDGRQALHAVSLELRRGEKVALVGPNGAGKSTFLLHLNGILRGAGTITVCGLAVVPANLPVIRSLVGLVFQDPDDQLFSPTVFEDAAFGPLHMGLPEHEVRRRAMEALERVGVAQLADRMSHHLSAGEKKRAAMATVLGMEPELLALDEPSAGLDPRARRRLMCLLADLPHTMLVATHDMGMVREVLPRTVVMDAGVIVADGPTTRLFEDVALLTRHGLEPR